MSTRSQDDELWAPVGLMSLDSATGLMMPRRPGQTTRAQPLAPYVVDALLLREDRAVAARDARQAQQQCVVQETLADFGRDLTWQLHPNGPELLSFSEHTIVLGWRVRSRGDAGDATELYEHFATLGEELEGAGIPVAVDLAPSFWSLGVLSEEQSEDPDAQFPRLLEQFAVSSAARVGS